MKNLAIMLAVLGLAACELQPAPPPPPAPATPPAGSAQPTGSATGSAPAAAQVIEAGSAGSAQVVAAGSAAPAFVRPPPPPPVDVTPQCEQAGIKLAELMIAGAEDSQKPAFERDRANIVRRTEVVCSQQHWAPAALACIAQSKTDTDARACLEKFPAPAVKGQGSAAAPTPHPSDAQKREDLKKPH